MLTKSPTPARRVVVYFNGTFVNQRNGAHARMSSLMAYLLDAGFDVTLFSFENHPSEPWDAAAKAKFSQVYPGARLVLDRWTPRLRRRRWWKTLATAFFPGKARAVLTPVHPGLSPNYEALIAAEPETPWIVNYADALTQLNGLPPGPVIVETHDVRFVNIAKLAGTSPLNLRSLLRLRSETSVLEAASALIAISPAEAGFFRTLLSGPEVFYVPSYEAAPRAFPVEAPSGGYVHDLLFVGSDNPQNARGLRDLLLTAEDWAGALRIGVAGGVCDNAEIRALAATRPNLQLLGFVDDLEATYATAKAAISPVDGTGLKIKLVEALAHGRPVFASRHSMDGLPPGYGECVFPLTAEAVTGVLGAERRLAAARKAALAYVATWADAGELKALGAFLAQTATVLAGA